MANQRSFLNSAKWAYTGNLGDKAATAIFAIILAAFLGPREFGIVSIAVVYIGFLQMFLDQGLVTALIQRKHLEQEHLETVFWMDVSLSLFLIGVSFLLSGWWAARNHAPQAALVIPVMSISILFEALSVVQTSLLRRSMDFKSLSIRTNVSVVVGGALGITMAYLGFGVWSIVAQQIARDLTALTLLWKLSPWRPRFKFSWKHLKSLLGFSIPNFTAQLGVYADSQAGSVVLGLFFGPVAVGLYRVADRVMNSVTAISIASIQAVALPEFSRLQDSPHELRKSALTCIRVSSIITLPALAGLAVVSRPLMATIGPKWIPASDALKVLSLLGMALTFSYFTGPLMQALGKIRQIVVLEWARTAVSVSAIVVAGLLVRGRSDSWQVMGIAMGRFVASACIVVPIFIYILMKLCGISLKDLTTAVAPSAIAGCSVAGSVGLLHLSRAFIDGRPAVVLVTEMAVGGVVGLSALLGLDPQLRPPLVALFRKVFRLQSADHKPLGTPDSSVPAVDVASSTDEYPTKVTVVIPTYNRAYILPHALESALGQTYPDFEILVVDDGSSDNTREIVENFKNDKIRYIRHEQNRGCSAAYNTGITEATGQIVAFLDSDDAWKPSYLERQMGFLSRHPEVEAVFCDTEIQGPATSVSSLISLMRAFPALLRTKPQATEFVVSAREMYLCLLEEVPIKPTAVLVRREMFDRVGVFDEAWPSGTDWDLFLRMSRVACFGYIDQVLVTQKRTSDSTCEMFVEKDKVFLLGLFLKEKAVLSGDPDALRRINRGMGILYNSLAWAYLESGRRKEALSTYYQGFKETSRPLLLRKLTSAVVRVAIASVRLPRTTQ